MDAVTVGAPAPRADMGEPLRRSESVAKVTGRPIYAADAAVAMPLQAYFLTSAIARGHILSIDTAPAEALIGVVKIYTHLNAPCRISTPYTQKGGYVSDTNMPLTGAEIHNDGQIIAMVIAETYEIARDASHRDRDPLRADGFGGDDGQPWRGHHAPRRARREGEAGR